MGGEWLNMQPFEIFIAHISWATGGKSRPVLVMEHDGNNLKVFSVTSQYQNKSANMQAKYLEIKDWQLSGLDKQSYIDTNKKIELPDSVISAKTPVGNLTETDKQRLLEFLEEK